METNNSMKYQYLIKCVGVATMNCSASSTVAFEQKCLERCPTRYSPVPARA